MERDEVLDLMFGPVDVALILIDRTQLVVIEENRVVPVTVEPGAKSLHRLRLVLVVAFD
jgi:hypothetical protein